MIGTSGIVNDENLEALTDQLIANADDDDEYEYEVASGDGDGGDVDPVTTYDDLFKSSTSGGGNLFEVPPKEAYSFEQLTRPVEEEVVFEKEDKKGTVATKSTAAAASGRRKHVKFREAEDVLFAFDDEVDIEEIDVDDVEWYEESDEPQQATTTATTTEDEEKVEIEVEEEEEEEIVVEEEEEVTEEFVVEEDVGEEGENNNENLKNPKDNDANKRGGKGDDGGGGGKEEDQSDSSAESGPIPQEVTKVEKDGTDVDSDYDEAQEFDASDSGEESSTSDDVNVDGNEDGKNNNPRNEKVKVGTGVAAADEDIEHSGRYIHSTMDQQKKNDDGDGKQSSQQEQQQQKRDDKNRLSTTTPSSSAANHGQKRVATYPRRKNSGPVPHPPSTSSRFNDSRRKNMKNNVNMNNNNNDNARRRPPSASNGHPTAQRPNQPSRTFPNQQNQKPDRQQQQPAEQQQQRRRPRQDDRHPITNNQQVGPVSAGGTTGDGNDSGGNKSSKTKPESSRVKGCVIFLSALIIVAVGVVILYFSLQRNNGTRPRVVFPLTPSPAPTTMFLRSPTPSIAPQQQPSPSTPSNPTVPSQPVSPSNPTVPTQPSVPTPTVTLPPQPPPPNDLCINAIGPIPSDESDGPISGDISFATFDNVDRCGEIENDDADNEINGGRRGLWYTVIGTGGEMLAHTCRNTNFDSQITIFAGSCNKPVCMEGNDNFCGGTGTQSAVSWHSNYLEPYQILIQGPSLADMTDNPFFDGTFELEVLSRYNDECNTAIGPLDVGPGPLLLGDTLDANPNAISCNGQVNDSPSVFYTVRGTGGEITVSVCEGNDFDVTVSLLVGDCTNLQCLIQTGPGQCTLTFASLAFADYYLLIHGRTATDVGNFGIRLTTTDSRDNNECQNALGPLQTDGTVITGSTIGASVDSSAPYCQSAVTAPGVWYYVFGTGTTLQASLCNDDDNDNNNNNDSASTEPSTSYDTRISIYEGECDDGNLSEFLSCVEGNDDFCGKQSLVTWSSMMGKVYFVHIHGYLQSSGDFQLRVTAL